MQKLIFWLLFLFFGLPILGIILLQFMGAIAITGMSTYINKIMFPSWGDGSYQIAGIEKVLNSSTDYGTKKGFIALSNFNNIAASRTINFSTVVSPVSLLNSGESLPKNDFMDVFIQARSVNYGRAECQRISGMLARDCVVTNSNVSKLNNGQYKMNITLGFVQKDDFGKVDASEKVSYQEVRKNLLNKDVYSIEQAEIERINIYKSVVQQCDFLRKNQGNCAIYRIKINSRSYPSQSKMTLSSQAVFSFLQGRTNLGAVSEINYN